MKLTVLGSGTLIPVPSRGNSAYVLETSSHVVLIDGGSGTLRRMADFGLNYGHIDTIAYTHLHPDHTVDLIPLLFAFKHDPRVKLPSPLTIVAPNGFRSHFDRLMDIYGTWVLPDNLEIEIKEVFRESLSLGDVRIICNHTEHTDYSVTYRFVEGEGRDLFYSGDTDECQELIDSARGTAVLLLECSYPDEKKRKGHLTPSLCGKIAAETGCGRLILTHFYPEVLMTDIVSVASQFYSGRIDLAYDGMEVVI